MKNGWNVKCYNENEMKLICVIGNPARAEQKEIKNSSASSRINCWKVYGSEQHWNRPEQIEKNIKLMNNSLKYVRNKFHWITDIWISFQSCHNKPDH